MTKTPRIVKTPSEIARFFAKAGGLTIGKDTLTKRYWFTQGEYRSKDYYSYTALWVGMERFLAEQGFYLHEKC